MTSLNNQLVHAVSHGFFKVDFEIVWQTIHRDLPRLHSRIRDAQTSMRKGAV